MATSFDGVNLIATLDAPVAGVLNQTWEQVYDDAKQWHLNANNRKYPFPFLTSGGEQITATTIAGQYYFWRNDLGWRIETTDESQDVFWEGNGIPTDIDQRIFNSMTGRTIAHLGLQPLVTGLSGLELAVVQELMDFVTETGYTYLQVYRILAAHAAGRLNQAGDGSYAIRDLNNTKDRIVGDDSINGGRIITTLDGD
jgi:hypothetical protein